MTDQQTREDSGRSEHWERDLLNRLAFASLNEQRRTRRWGIFFKLAILAYLFALLFASPLGGGWGESITAGRHTALVELDGVIAPEQPASADRVVTGLRRAFEQENSAGVILRINSPGGSPVQAGYIYDEILRLKEEHPDTRVIAVVTDVCASGGYYAAAAADEIYANQASIVGSIGVLMNGFGFTQAMEKLGVERRLLTAGEHKAMLDPFSPVDEDEVAHAESMLDEIHEQFITAVKKGRGEHLADNDDDIFSGLFWTGERSMELGLVDGLGSASHVAREVIGAEDIVNYTPRREFWDRFSSGLGAAIGSALRETDVLPSGWTEPAIR